MKRRYFGVRNGLLVPVTGGLAVWLSSATIAVETPVTGETAVSPVTGIGTSLNGGWAGLAYAAAMLLLLAVTAVWPRRRRMRAEAETTAEEETK